MKTKHLIPGHLVRKVGTHVPKSNQEVIMDYLTQEAGTVELTDIQKKLLERWDCADNLMRMRKYKKSEVARMLVKKFEIGIATARNDLAEAEYIFGSTRKFSKTYIIQNHLERIEDMIIDAQRQGKDEVVIRLLDIYNRAIFSMPDALRKEMPPTKIVYNFTQNNNTQEIYVPAAFSEEDAKRVAAKRLQEMGISLEPFELTQYVEEGKYE